MTIAVSDISIGQRLLSTPAVGRYVLLPPARRGIRRQQITGDTPRSSYVAMRRLFGNRDPDLFDELVRSVPGDHESLPDHHPAPGLLEEEIADAVEALTTDGYYVARARLPPASCEDLEVIARRASCRLIGGPHDGCEARYDPAAPLAVRYDVPEEDVVQAAAAQRVIADRSLLAIATRYLGTCPVQDLVAMWWSTSRDDGAASAAAQKFHFDLDRLRFLKVFVFLTDVDADTGPHVYVPGSHRDLPWELRVDGRHSDAEVTARLDRPPERISGPRGTIFLADTRGLHKGQPLRRGQRLVFQTEYAVALFGAPFTSPHLAEPTSELLDLRRAHPSVLARFR